MIEAAGVSALIVDDRGQKRAAELRAQGVDVLVLTPDALGGGRALAAPRPVDPADTAYVLFTSGSTGRPKGVPITHGNTAHYFQLLAGRYDFTPDDVFSQTFDLTFDCAMFDLFCAWAAGGHRGGRAAARVRRPAPLPGRAGDHRVVLHPQRDLPGTQDGRARRGGDAHPALELLRRRSAEVRGRRPTGSGPRARPPWRTSTAPTELTITITGHRWSGETSPGRCVNGLSPIGTVHPGHGHLLVGEDGRTVHDEGELWITGPQLTPGYLDPADDKGRFVERDGRTWYNTGDRVRVADNGELVYLGRADAQVQVHGWRVELAEIDHAVRGVAGVVDAVTVSAETQWHRRARRVLHRHSAAAHRFHHPAYRDAAGRSHSTALSLSRRAAAESQQKSRQSRPAGAGRGSGG